jgi:hypothetical protein
MSRIAVLLPGIMGSTLHYDGSGHIEEIWGEDFNQNYRRLLKNPDLLKWTGQVACAKLLETVNVSSLIPFYRQHLWKKTLGLISQLDDFQSPDSVIKCGYDWRPSLTETAPWLVNYLSSQIGAPLGSIRPQAKPKCVFLTHSMGGLLIRVAIGLNLIDPTWIDRIIHIGTPLEGAPVSFRVAFDRTSLPLLNELLHIFHWKNYALFKSNLLHCIRSFPSIYELFPRKELKYIWYSQNAIRNPLEEEYLTPFCRYLAETTHGFLIEAESKIAANKIKVICIYTTIHECKPTEIMYRVQALGPPDLGYKVEEVMLSTVHGDGTVPKDSACGANLSALGKSVFNVEHALLCNSASVVEIMSTIL